MDKLKTIEKVKELLEVYNLDEDLKIVASEYLDNIDTNLAKEIYDVLISNADLYANGKIKSSEEVQNICKNILDASK